MIRKLGASEFRKPGYRPWGIDRSGSGALKTFFCLFGRLLDRVSFCSVNWLELSISPTQQAGQGLPSALQPMAAGAARPGTSLPLQGCPPDQMCGVEGDFVPDWPGRRSCLGSVKEDAEGGGLGPGVQGLHPREAAGITPEDGEEPALGALKIKFLQCEL